MESKNEKAQVLNWMKSGCNYDEGARLYQRIGRNESLKKLFPGKRHRYARKLMYELCKSAGIDWTKLDGDEPVKGPGEKLAVVSAGQQKTELPAAETELPTTIGGYPRQVRRVMLEYAELFQERSKTHRLMVGMGDSNAEAVKKKRKELFDLVKAYSVRLEQLYAARQAYEKNGELPNEEKLWPKPKAQPTLPDDADELKKMKKNLQTSNAKDQILLDYQTKTKQAKTNPMPTGPKRMKLENRIKARSKKIEEIDYKLNSQNAH